MADVNTQEIYDLTSKKFGIGTTGTIPDRFYGVFFSACKYITARIRLFADGASITTPSDLATDFTGLDEDIFFACVSSGLDAFISSQGQWQDEPKGDLAAIWERDLKAAQAVYQRETTAITGRLGSL